MNRVKARIARASGGVGEGLAAWRKLQGLTAQQVAERSGISRGTLRRIENGQTTVGFESVLSVARTLGQLDRVVDSFDPFTTDYGRMRSSENLPKRVRQ